MLRRLLFTALVFGAACLQTSAQEKTPDVKKEVKKEEKKQTAPALAPTKANVPMERTSAKYLISTRPNLINPPRLSFIFMVVAGRVAIKKVLPQSPSLMRASPLLQSTTGM
jgi:hypothetical protein